MKTFSSFLDKKHRDSLEQLKLIQKALENNGLNVENFLDKHDDPYIFCFNPNRGTSFDGVRIYKIGDEIAYRVQKQSKTHPYGRAYQLQIEKMFQDLKGDEKMDDQKAGQKIIGLIAEELKYFFEKSKEAEGAEREEQGENSGDIIIRSTGTDYSSLISNRN